MSDSSSRFLRTLYVDRVCKRVCDVPHRFITDSTPLGPGDAARIARILDKVHGTREEQLLAKRAFYEGVVAMAMDPLSFTVVRSDDGHLRTVLKS